MWYMMKDSSIDYNTVPTTGMCVMYVSDVLIACEETNNDNAFGTFKKIYLV